MLGEVFMSISAASILLGWAMHAEHCVGGCEKAWTAVPALDMLAYLSELFGGLIHTMVFPNPIHLPPLLFMSR